MKSSSCLPSAPFIATLDNARKDSNLKHFMYQPTIKSKGLLLILTYCDLEVRVGSQFFHLVILGELNEKYFCL